MYPSDSQPSFSFAEYANQRTTHVFSFLPKQRQGQDKPLQEPLLLITDQLITVHLRPSAKVNKKKQHSLKILIVALITQHKNK